MPQRLRHATAVHLADSDLLPAGSDCGLVQYNICRHGGHNGQPDFCNFLGRHAHSGRRAICSFQGLDCAGVRRVAGSPVGLEVYL